VRFRGTSVKKALVIPGVVVAAGGGLAHGLTGNDEPPSRVDTGRDALVQPATHERNAMTERSRAAEPRETLVTLRLRKTKRRSTLVRGAPAGADANRQVGALATSISARTADGELMVDDANKLLAKADKGGIEVGELGLLRELAERELGTRPLDERFQAEVDRIVPDGAPTARMAAVIFRIDPAIGRKQLLDMLEASPGLVAGGPKTFVIRDGAEPYIAAITTGQVIAGLVKFTEGATASEARRIRAFLHEQLRVLELPVSRGGLRVPGLTGERGLALAAQTAQGPAIAINQSAFVLKALEKAMKLEGAENRALAKRARSVAGRVATELKSDLAFAYPAKGPVAYGLVVTAGRPAITQLEDGDHLLTTISALKGLDVYKDRFAPVVRRMERRHPDLKLVGPEDLDGRAGHVFTDDFNAFRSGAKRAAEGGLSEGEEARLARLAERDGLRSTGEDALLSALDP
jgi:hypothetical protein